MHFGSCRSIQNPPKGVETVSWTVRRAFWILPEHTESSKRRGNCILDGPACILDLAGAYRILQKAWKLYVGRSGVHFVFCRSIQNPPKGVETVCWTVRRAFWILPHHHRTHRDRCASHMMHVSLPRTRSTAALGSCILQRERWASPGDKRQGSRRARLVGNSARGGELYFVVCGNVLAFLGRPRSALVEGPMIELLKVTARPRVALADAHRGCC